MAAEMGVKAKAFWSGDSWKSFEFAKALEEAERYEDMVKVVKAAAEKDNEVLVAENRNLLSIAYKNIVGLRRAAWRTLRAKAEDNKEKVSKERIEVYINTVVDELKLYCNEIINLIDVILEKVKECPDGKEKHENTVFFYKMKGDYYRYMCEIAVGEEKTDFTASANEAYERAKEKGEDLPSTHPIKLGLVLNYSVFQYEIQNNSNKACQMAKKAFDSAIAELDRLEEPDYKDSTLIMQLLRDNLTLWTADGDGDGDADDDDDKKADS